MAFMEKSYISVVLGAMDSADRVIAVDWSANRKLGFADDLTLVRSGIGNRFDSTGLIVGIAFPADVLLIPDDILTGNSQHNSLP